MASQSALDCSEEAGDVNSIWFAVSVAVPYTIIPLRTWLSHIFNPKFIQGFGNLDLLCGVEVGRRKLFALAQRAVNDLKSGKVVCAGYAAYRPKVGEGARGGE